MSALPYVYAAILDVLGYRERLAHDRKRGVLEFKDVLQNSLQCLQDINDAEFAHQTISDTVILTCADRLRVVDFLTVLRDVQVSFLVNGAFLRGGVTFQQHFRSGAITYSHAYAGAHELEASLAIYPRIVVDHNIVDMFESSGNSDMLRGCHLLCECNGVFFVNIVDEDNWQTLYEKAREMYRAESARIRQVEGVFAKHLWFQEYLMSSPHALPKSERYMPGIRVWAPEGN
ncbi:MAG: hypothetical protein J5J06_01330 [Phycisphaerae bacterium]|nr:hypothetical protein [Phycisphaerae bacterium]